MARVTTQRARAHGSMLIPLACAALIAACGERAPIEARSHYQGEMAGEATPTSIILQARLTETGELVAEDVIGRAGEAAFEVSTDKGFAKSRIGPWLRATAAGDFIVKERVTGLEPGATYFYRLHTKLEGGRVALGPVGRFKLPGGAEGTDAISLVIVTGMNNYKFRMDKKLRRVEKARGFPALSSIVDLEPDYFVSTGDSVYYDPHPDAPQANTEATMRREWHRQFATPRFQKLFRSMATYWEKDDHDYRYNNAGSHGSIPPSAELGARIFIEQVPVVDPGAKPPRTYRTHRLSRELQIWMLESRDHRSKCDDDDDPNKTLWGPEQKAWLERTLLESDATFKLLISPTPMIGPDNKLARGFHLPGQKDRLMRDNHADPPGYRREGEQFFSWASAHGLTGDNLLIVCGDRHWKYHAIRPDGFEEFACGALVRANSRLGPKPGDPESTDPEGQLRQAFREDKKHGGFLHVTVGPGERGGPPRAVLTHYTEKGTKLYSTTKLGQPAETASKR